MLHGMGWIRAGVIATAVVGVGILGLGLVDCADPTQIVVEVYSDACPGSGAGKGKEILQTGIAVGRPDEIDDKPPSSVRSTCESPSKRGVGSLVITPSGEKDEEIAIKVVGAVDTSSADRCGPAPGYAGCIVQRRIMRFVPNTSVRARVQLSLACLSRTCDEGFTCDQGVCKASRDLNPDGTSRPDAPTKEAGITPEAGTDAGSPDACAGCFDQCLGGKCTVDCNKAGGCPNTELCAKDLPCDISCGTKGNCDDIRCTTSAKCSVNCTGPKDTCSRITCNAAECDVGCKGDKTCETAGGIHLDASISARLRCDGNDACRAAKASCGSPDCELYCEPLGGGQNACPLDASAPCTGGCTDWNKPRPID